MNGNEDVERNEGQPITGREPQPEEAVEARALKVTIHKVVNGFIIKVGCKEFVSEDWEKVSKGLAEYWKNPAEAEKKFCG